MRRECGRIPANEMHAYGRHEDCWVGSAPPCPLGRLPMAVRIAAYNHESGRRVTYTPPRGL